MTPRLVLPLLASVALASGCGGSSSPSTPPAAGRASTAPSSATSAPVAAPSSAAAAASSAPGGSSSTTTTGSAAAPGAAAAPAPAAGKPGSSTTATTSPPSTPPGTYTYDTSGTFSAGTPRDASGTATLTVEPASAGTQHSTLSDGQGKTEQDVVVRPNGTYLSRLVITNPAFTKEFRFAPPVLLLPEPATNGRSYSWTARSTDGKTTASVTARIDRRETIPIGGASVPTVVVKSTLKLTGDITYTGTMETWRDPAHRLTVKEHAVGKGTVSGFMFSSDITSVARSTRPS